MRTCRNAVFAVLTFACLMLSIGSVAMARFTGYDLPTQSALEGRKYQTLPTLSVDSAASGTYQGELEQYLSDRVPKRERVALTNALLQYRTIQVANIVFRYKTIPTFYDSEYYIDDESGRVWEQPYTRDGEEELTLSAVSACNDLASSQRDVRWRIALVDRSATCGASPLQALVTDSVDYAFFRNLIEGNANESIEFIDLSDLSEPDVIADNYFKTDHHWQIEGALVAYRRIVNSFEGMPIDFGETFIVCDEPYYGSFDRRGLTQVIYDSVNDVSYNHGTYSVRIDGEEKDMSALCEGFGDTPYRKSSRFANVYADYFHTDYGLIEIENDAVGSGALLIVGDSYTNSMDRFFAENYRTVYVLDPRHYKGTVRDFVSTHDIDDCVFILSANNFANQRFIDSL